MKLLNLTAALFLGGVLQAQNPLPAIHPQPQEVTLSTNRMKAPHGFTLSGMQHPDEDAMRLIRQTLSITDNSEALPLKITSLEDRTPELKRSGAYLLVITPEEIDIAISDSRGLFYAAQTLQQLAQTDGQGNTTLPLGVIKDYPDVAYRGTVEGFYGDPWSHTDRIEQLRFYGKMKMNTYIYGPKDDPYHSSPNWRKPYPEKEAAQIKDLVKEAAANKVDFVWAIHPGQDIKWNATDSNNVITKFEQMYDLGVRAFAVFFDDISGEGTNAAKQAGLMNFIQKEFIEKKSDIQPLIMCPTEYNRSWARTDYLDILGEQLHPAIHIMWTGNRVVDDITLEGLEWVNKRIRRPAYIWWNFPVSDYCRDHLLMGPAYGLDTQASNAMSGFVANPMERAEASKVALFGVAMYSWNIHSYDPQLAWEKACEYLVPKAAIAFKTFCENNSDPGPNGHLYRREESTRYQAQADKFLTGYRNGQFGERDANQLGALSAQIQAAPELIYNQGDNKALIKEINPWLMQFELLGRCGSNALRMAHAWYEKDRQNTWQRFLEVSAVMDSMKLVNRTFNQNPYQKGVKVGSRVLMPLIEGLYRQTSRNLLSTADTPSNEIRVSTASTITNIDQLKNQPWSEDENLIAYVPMLEVVKVEPNQYLGLGWEIQKDAESFTFNLPQSNVDGRVFEWSEDGKTWTILSDIPADRTKFTVTTIPLNAHFVRMRNNSGKQMELKVAAFSVKTKEAPEINEELMMYDLNLSTYKTLKPGEKVEVKCNGVDKYIEFFLSGNNDSMVSISGVNNDGENNMLYCGYVGYVKLNKISFDDMQTLIITPAGKTPVQIHQIVRE